MAREILTWNWTWIKLSSGSSLKIDDDWSVDRSLVAMWLGGDGRSVGRHRANGFDDAVDRSPIAFRTLIDIVYRTSEADDKHCIGHCAGGGEAVVCKWEAKIEIEKEIEILSSSFDPSFLQSKLGRSCWDWRKNALELSHLVIDVRSFENCPSPRARYIVYM